MRYKQVPTAPTSAPEASPTARDLPSPTAMLERAAAAAGLRREGFVDDARRAATPHIVLIDGLTRTNLPVGVFEPELQKRINWCRQQAADWAIEPVGANPEQLTGRRFRFSDLDDARRFRDAFPTQL
jgi:hypothetical protein